MPFDAEVPTARPGGSPRTVDWLLQPACFAPLLAGLGLLTSAAFIHQRLPASDEGAILAQAARILRGAVFYRDLDAYPFPGAPYLLAAVMRVFGEHVSVARWLGASVFCATLVAMYRIALQVLSRRRAATLCIGLLGLKFVAWPGLTIFSYWDLAFLFACAGIALLLPELVKGAAPPGRLAAAGVAMGLALATKQSLGIYLVATSLSLLLFAPRPGAGVGWNRNRIAGAAALAGGVGSVLLPMFAYFAAHGLLGSMLHSGLLRPLVAYLPTSGTSGIDPLRWWELGAYRGAAALPYFVEPYWQLLQQQRLPGSALYPLYWLAGEVFSRTVYTSIPLALLGAARIGWRARGGALPAPDRALVVLAVLCFPAVLSAFPRADFPHIINVYPLVLVLLAGLWQRFATRRWPGSRGRRAARLETTAVCIALAATGTLAAVNHAHLTYRMRVERADLRIDPGFAWVESIVEAVRAEVPEDRPLLVYGHEAYFYFLTERFYPWPFVQLYPGQAGSDGGQRLAALLDREPPAVIIRGMLNIPGVPHLPSYAPILERRIRARYVRDDGVFQRFPLRDAPKVRQPWAALLVPRPGVRR